MDQRKLMDNANTITDISKTQNNVYEIVSDISARQDTIDERLTVLEEKLQTVQDQLEALPEILARCLQQHQDRVDQRRNFLHPDAAVTGPPSLTAPGSHNTNQLLLPHSRSVPSASVPINPWSPGSALMTTNRTIHLNADSTTKANSLGNEAFKNS